MSTNIPTSLVTRSVSCRAMPSLTRQRIYDSSSIDPQSVPEMLADPLDIWKVIDQSYNDECDAEYLTQQQKCVTRMSSVNYDNNIILNLNNDRSISEEEEVISHKIKRETIDDYCFGMTFTECFVPPASSVLNRPLPVPGTPQDENYRFDLPLRRLEPPAGTIEHKDYMYDAVSALLEKTRSLLKSSQVQDNAETNTLCQNVQQILENWSGFDVIPHDSSKVNPETDWGVQEYDAALNEDATPLYVEDREYENDDDDDDDGFQEQTDYEGVDEFKSRRII